MTRLVVHAQYEMKDKPHDEGGLNFSSISYGVNKAVSLSDMLFAINLEVIKCYLEYTDEDTVKQEINNTIELLEKIEIETKKTSKVKIKL